MDEEKYDSQGILDGLATTILPKAGFEKANLMKNPYYSPLLDEEILHCVEKWKAGINLFANK